MSGLRQSQVLLQGLPEEALGEQAQEGVHCRSIRRALCVEQGQHCGAEEQDSGCRGRESKDTWQILTVLTVMVMLVRLLACGLS